MVLDLLKGGCRVGFVGLGVSNISLLTHLPLEDCEITIRSEGEVDDKLLPSGLHIKGIFYGRDALKNINEDILFLSPSVRRERDELVGAKKRGVLLSSDMELFFEENKTPTLAITGSDGKSTTATLTHLLLKSGGYKSALVGNIGKPFTENLGHGYDFFVSELSSFMLRYCSPRIAVGAITNITPNHLDWHESRNEYIENKLAITRNAEKVVINDENIDIPGAYGITSVEKSLNELMRLYKAELYLTSENGYILKNGRKILSTSEVKRSEKHNIKNLMTAIAITDGLIDRNAIKRVAESFSGLEHRCELFLNKNGVDFIDSSIDSTPARTVQTLTSLNRDVVIILGGRGKGLNYGDMVHSIKRYVKKAIICGENATEIYLAIGNVISTEITDSFDDAVILGSEYAKSVGALLLSPASTSYDKFKNYSERGNKFKEIIYKLSLI